MGDKIIQGSVTTGARVPSKDKYYSFDAQKKNFGIIFKQNMKALEVAELVASRFVGGEFKQCPEGSVQDVGFVKEGNSYWLMLKVPNDVADDITSNDGEILKPLKGYVDLLSFRFSTKGRGDFNVEMRLDNHAYAGR